MLVIPIEISARTTTYRGLTWSDTEVEFATLAKMNISKIVTTISTELANTATKTISNPIKTTPIIDGLSGLDALACQKMPVIKKYFPYFSINSLFIESLTTIVIILLISSSAYTLRAL